VNYITNVKSCKSFSNFFLGTFPNTDVHKCDIVGDGHLRSSNQSSGRNGSPGLSFGRKAERHQQLAAAGSAQKLATGAGLQVQETDCGSAKDGVRFQRPLAGIVSARLRRDTASAD